MIENAAIGLRKASLFIILLTVFGLILGLLSNNVANADDLPVIHVSGTLGANETWSAGSVYVLDSTVTVPNGVTLTINNGAIVKFPYGYWVHGITVSQGGTLDVNGTSTSSVIFTSLRDDAAGGDSGSDGATSGAMNDYSIAIEGAGGAIDVQYATFQYAGVAFATNCGSAYGAVSFVDSAFSSPVSYNYCNNVSFQHNDFSVPQSYNPVSTYDSDMSGFVLSGSNTNTFDGSGKDSTLSILDGRVGSGSTWIVDGDASGAVLAIRNLNVIGTLNLQPGTIVKNELWNLNLGVKVSQGGAVNVAGTSGSPVIFTSLEDDSVGGDAANNGATSGGAEDYGTAIYSASGTVSVSHGVFKKGKGSVSGECTQGGGLTVTDSSLEATLGASYCNSSGSLIVERNEFDLATGSGNYAIDANNVRATGIALAGVNKNIFSGNGLHKVVRLYDNILIPAGSSWTVEAASGTILETKNIVVDGTLNIGSDVMIKAMQGETAIKDNGIVNIDSGAVIKLEAGATGVAVNQNAELNIMGTANSPVTFTSMKDDSIGGDTGGDGSTTGAAGDYGVAVYVKQAGASVEMANVSITYANTAFGAEDGQANLASVDIADVYYGISVNYADVVFRGSLSSASVKGIQACNWGSYWSCSVDASYVDWGSAAGPFSGSGSMVCGSVTVSPWIVGSSTDSGELFDVPNCDNTARPSQQLSTSVTGFQNAVSQERIDCDNGFQDACQAIENAFACLGGAVQLAASTTPIPITFTNPTEVLDTVQADTVGAANTFIAGMEAPSVTTFTLDVANGLLDVINLFTSLKTAYDTCAP